jgi:hypothetical protein
MRLRALKKKLFILFPTQRTLQRIPARYPGRDPHPARREAAVAGLPRGGHLKGKDTRHTETDMAYGELEMVLPDGHGIHHLDWQPEKAVPLRKNLLRLTAPTPA